MKILLLIFFLICSPCSFAQNYAKVKQIQTAEQVVLKYDTIRQCVNIISFPFEFELYKTVKCEMKVKLVDYYYADTSEKDFCEVGWGGVPYWIENKGKYILNSSLTDALEKSLERYLVRSVHFIADNSDIQDSLINYVCEMKKKRMYTLSVGTMGEFKYKHSGLVARCLKGDSVQFRMHIKNKKYLELIAVPVSY